MQWLSNQSQNIIINFSLQLIFQLAITPFSPNLLTLLRMSANITTPSLLVSPSFTLPRSLPQAPTGDQCSVTTLQHVHSLTGLMLTLTPDVDPLMSPNSHSRNYHLALVWQLLPLTVIAALDDVDWLLPCCWESPPKMMLITSRLSRSRSNSWLQLRMPSLSSSDASCTLSTSVVFVTWTSEEKEKNLRIARIFSSSLWSRPQGPPCDLDHRGRRRIPPSGSKQWGGGILSII